ncbi:MAG: hypothetical protein ABIS47_02645 [Acidimicrobiales bacterium]
MAGRRLPPRRGRAAAGLAVAGLVAASVVGLSHLRPATEVRGATEPEALSTVEPTASSVTPLLADPDAPVTVPLGSAPAATAPPALAMPPAAPADRTTPFRGMGAWVDVFEWAPSYVKPPRTAPNLGPGAVDAMAAAGVQVLYIQATRYNNPTGGDIVDPEILAQWIARAKANGLAVVAWYLPTLTDPAADLRRFQAMATLPDVAGIGVDIESTAVVDPTVRSSRMVALAKSVRAALPDRALSAIVLPPVDTDVVNLKYWPGFPWREVRRLFDVWQPMGYWTNRTVSSGYRDAERYTRENVERLRVHLGDPAAVVHPIGGIMNKATPGDVTGYLKAVRETGSVGASLYTWGTQKPEIYPLMRAARR